MILKNKNNVEFGEQHDIRGLIIDIVDSLYHRDGLWNRFKEKCWDSEQNHQIPFEVFEIVMEYFGGQTLNRRVVIRIQFRPYPYGGLLKLRQKWPWKKKNHTQIMIGPTSTMNKTSSYRTF
ncbi:MAG: hypothetical protein GY714_14175 [Desulfobacterales bacterium]|nr:hypothetical protein [Desulfobacterales bacterium]